MGKSVLEVSRYYLQVTIPGISQIPFYGVANAVFCWLSFLRVHVNVKVPLGLVFWPRLLHSLIVPGWSWTSQSILNWFHMCGLELTENPAVA